MGALYRWIPVVWWLIALDRHRLFNGITRSYTNAEEPRAEEPLETPQAQQFSDSESEDEEEDAAMRGLLNS
jgi:hypothetical protein